ncbi:MAG: glucose-6-phosphate dehydrogenase, partial [Pirellulales bacterium]|nr:glucose-6-phosphate dehydrogenase [Pirellulales bacterium]
MENTIVIFGASGDLTSRKLIPALYELKRKGRLPDGTRIIGTSRTEFSHAEWRERLAQSTAEFVGQRFDRKVWDELAPSVCY